MSKFITQVAEKVFDSFVNGIKNIDTDHYYIHAGKKFFYGENFSIASTGTKLFSFKTPTVASGLDIHFRPVMFNSSADKLLIELIEGNTYTGGDDKLESIFNANRKHSNTTNMQEFYSGTTESAAGTVLLPDYIGGGTSVGGQSSGGGNPQKEEMILKQNTIYTVKLTNNSSNTNIVNAIFSWYEETVI